MDALDLLHTRVSVPVLGEPGPSAGQLDSLFRAALRAPDHRVLRPWRFLTISGDDRCALAELFVQAARADEPDLAAEREEKMRGKPMRAPTIVVVVGAPRPDDKVPELEQLISAGCCANNMMLAAHALGLGAMWRTGSMASHPLVLRGLGLAPEERVLGFLYIGTPCGAIKRVPALDPADFVSRWPPEH